MDFALTEELTIIRDTVREFAEGELVPRATQHDRDEKLDPALFDMLGELGMWGLIVPESHGGSELGNLALAVVLEELNRACASTGARARITGSHMLRWWTPGRRQVTRRASSWRLTAQARRSSARSSRPRRRKSLLSRRTEGLNGLRRDIEKNLMGSRNVPMKVGDGGYSSSCG